MNRLSQLRQVRKEKLARLREMGIDPYPPVFHRTHTASELVAKFQELEETAPIATAGRLMSLREMGKTTFAHIQDGSGRIQIYFRADDMEEGAFDLLRLCDLGDFIGVEGVVFRTRTGEISVRAAKLTLLSKGLLPLPVVKEKEGRQFDAVTDKEMRYRQRHVDLIYNAAVRQTLERRTSIVRSLREFLDARSFLEVETPILQTIYGGASARPFLTKHNALSIDLYLRIALELHLKRILIGGIEKVYEIGRVFRNEGMDRNHNPEFTMLEFYWSYADYRDAMDLVEELFRWVARETLGSLRLVFGGVEIDLEPPFRRVPMADLVREHAGIDIDRDDESRLRSYLIDAGCSLPPVPDRGRLIEHVFDAAVVPKLEQPTFVLDHPRSISPLTKAHRERPDAVVERFELFVAGFEFANAFSELNDPVDQRERLEEQNARRAMGDDEAQTMDEEFLLALEHGMPPAAGVGIGVDRLVMLLTGEPNIRDVLFFPLMRPDEGIPKEEEPED